VALQLVMNHVDDPCDRDAFSLVCKKWYQIDALTRKHVTVALFSPPPPADSSQPPLPMAGVSEAQGEA